MTRHEAAALERFLDTLDEAIEDALRELLHDLADDDICPCVIERLLDEHHAMLSAWRPRARAAFAALIDRAASGCGPLIH
jgi:hypothetical protein